MHRKIIPDLIQVEQSKKEGQLCELPAESSAFEAALQMVNHDVAAIAVTDENGKLKGIVTERDLTRRVMVEDRNPKDVCLKDIMTVSPKTVRPDDTAADALEIMRHNRCRHLPVVDFEDRVIAMVSIRHLYAAISLDLEDDVREYRSYMFDTGYGARQ